MRTRITVPVLLMAWDAPAQVEWGAYYGGEEGYAAYAPTARAALRALIDDLKNLP